MTQNNVWYFITTRVLPTPIGWCFSGDFHQSSWDREDPSPSRRWDHHGPPSERAQRDARPRLLRALQGNTQPAYHDSIRRVKSARPSFNTLKTSTLISTSNYWFKCACVCRVQRLVSCVIFPFLRSTSLCTLTLKQRSLMRTEDSARCSCSPPAPSQVSTPPFFKIFYMVISFLNC